MMYQENSGLRDDADPGVAAGLFGCTLTWSTLVVTEYCFTFKALQRFVQTNVFTILFALETC